MNGVNYKFFIFAPPFFILFIIFFSLLNFIRVSLKFEPIKKYNPERINYSYEILSSDNKLLSKLSRKFDVEDTSNLIPLFLKYSFISAEDKRFLNHKGIDLVGISRAFHLNIIFVSVLKYL